MDGSDLIGGKFGTRCRTINFWLLGVAAAARHHGRIAHITVTFTVSLPPEMFEVLEQVRARENRIRSELIGEG